MSGQTLKWIALISMIIDHIGLCLYPDMIWFRVLGRLAFPLYAFLLVEGYRHTRNVKAYMLRLGLLAIISEVPFDLMLTHSWFSFRSCSCIVTLLIGLLAMYGYERLSMLGQAWKYPAYLCFALAAAAAFGLRSDYDVIGILLIFVFYAFKDSKAVTVILSGLLYGVVSVLQLSALEAFVPIFLYNGQRGRDSRLQKTVCYLMYPVHMLIIYLVTVWR